MNNLKRVLSLALSGIMLVGMMAMGASAADFSDADKIEHTDAVNVLVALKVINGQDDGSFNPTGDVTRGQMAKMIAVAMNGGNDANTGVKGTPTFTDIKGHWAESYIEYCSDLGIISGRGDGTFDPDGNVTGLEATKMVLTALGYDATAYKLTGASWAVRTDELARQADPNLYDELTGVVMANKASRDVAAQLIWNGLQNTTKRVTPSTNTNTGEVTWSYGSGDMMLKERYDANIMVGTFTANSHMDTTAEAGEIVVTQRVREVDEDGTVSYGSAPYYVPSDFDIANIGEEVKVIYKNGKNSSTSGPDKNDTIYGVFLTGTTQVVNATKADVKDNKAAEAKIKVGSTKYTLDNSVTVMTNYDKSVTFTKDNESGKATNNGTAEGDGDNSDLTKALKGNNGDTIKLLLKDNKVERIYIVESKVGVVTSKNATKIGVNNGVGTLTIADHDIADDLAVNSVVQTTILYNMDKPADGLVIVKEAATVEGDVDEFEYDAKKNQNKTVTVDGTSYKVMDQVKNLFKTDVDGDVIDTFLDRSDVIGESVKLYLVNGFVAAAIQTSEAASNYSVVTDVKQKGVAGAVFDALQVQLMDSEGVKTIYSVAKKSDAETENKPADTDYPIGTLVTYTVNKDGEAVLKKVAEDKTVTEGYDKSKKSFNGIGTTKNCVLFATNSAGSWKAYSIRELGDVDLGEDMAASYAMNDNGYVVAAAMDLGTTPKGITSTAVYAVVTGGGTTVKVNGDPYKKWNASSNGEKYTLNVPTNDATISKGAIVWFEPSVDSTYDAGDIVVINKTTYKIEDDVNKVVVKAYVDDYDKADAVIDFFTEVVEVKEGEKVVAYEGKGDAQRLAVDENVAIYYVDVDSPASPESGSVGGFDTVTGYMNALLVKDSDNVVVAILVEVSGEGNIISLD